MANWLDFARALLGALGAPDTPDNEAALLTWFNAEQPPQGPNASFNPLNIQAGDFPHAGTSGSGQYNFVSFDDGVNQTAAFLRQGYYTGIVSALQSGNNAPAVLQAVQDSPWAEGHYGGQLVGQLNAILSNWSTYANGLIGGAPPGGSLGSGGVGVGGTTGAGTNATAQTVGITDFLGGAASDIVQPILDGAMRIVLIGVAVAGGLALIVIGATRVASPALEQGQNLASTVGPAVAMAAL